MRSAVLVFITFLSTLPVRGATYAMLLASLGHPLFLSTLPVRGATDGIRCSVSIKRFLSTLPVRGATGCHG